LITLNDSLPIKKVIFGLLIFCGSLITIFVLFIASVSIYVGFHHLGRHGFWTPVLFGLTVMILILWLFIHGIGYIRHQMKEKDIIHHI